MQTKDEIKWSRGGPLRVAGGKGDGGSVKLIYFPRPAEKAASLLNPYA